MSIQIAIRSESPPLRVDDAGVVRVGSSRITLDLVVEEFNNGMSPEAMVHAYDSLDLPDVYGAIAYYLSHREEVRDYLARRIAEAEAIRFAAETGSLRLTREDLLKRRSAAEKTNAPLGD